MKPEINKANKTFWDGIKDEKFFIQKCKKCNEIFFPSRILCPECLSVKTEYFESEGRGFLYAFTEIRTKTPGFKVPYIIGLIELDDKPGRFLSRIIAPYDSLKIGQRLRVKYEHLKGFSVHTFIPESS
jgi:uncharacterized OB-fold protein